MRFQPLHGHTQRESICARALFCRCIQNVIFLIFSDQTGQARQLRLYSFVMGNLPGKPLKHKDITCFTQQGPVQVFFLRLPPAILSLSVFVGCSMKYGLVIAIPAHHLALLSHFIITYYHPFFFPNEL